MNVKESGFSCILHWSCIVLQNDRIDTISIGAYHINPKFLSKWKGTL